MPAARALSRIALLAGVLLAGQGALVATGVLDHEAPRAVGVALVALGVGLALLGAWPRIRVARRGVVRALGASCVAGVLGYNLATSSGLAPPEWAILLYGAGLVLSSFHLDRRVLRTDVGTLVAYSFPLLLAPLALYALNAALAAQAGATPLSWYVRHLLAAPMAVGLGALGVDAALAGDTVRIATERGPLYLTVGVVCAGLYAAVLFLGVFALFAWQSRTRGMRLAAYLAVGLVGLHFANVLRLILLGWVGHRWGGEALQTAHEHAGWVLFVAWSLLFWAVVLRRLEGPAAVAA
ncbi:MAG TPA: exosortase/archaeosortase family protein [Candidatus Thermoplasmatota archaeon]|nr:exosortase/archaeosortase family protein [Candidatus Thermoplasmatota archaeon]